MLFILILICVMLKLKKLYWDTMERKERLKKLFFLLFLFVGLFIVSLVIGIIQNSKSSSAPYPSQIERIQNAPKEEPGGMQVIPSLPTESISPLIYYLEGI